MAAPINNKWLCKPFRDVRLFMSSNAEIAPTRLVK